MRVLVPFTPRHPKSRLGAVLSGRERQAFARVMFMDVLDTIQGAGGEPVVLSPVPLEDPPSTEIKVDERSLTTAVNAALEPPIAVVMADLALATSESLRSAFETAGDVVLAPGRGGGTNLLVVRDDAFRVDYHGNSLADHRRIARNAHLDITELDSHRLATDIDEPSDLVEVLLHGTGEAPDWLRAHGVTLHSTDGRVDIHRSE